MEGLTIELISALKPENLPIPLRTAIRYQELAVGETVFHQGDLATAVYAVETGRIRLSRYTIEGKLVTFRTISAGGSFAETALFYEHYQCVAISEVPSRVIIYPKQALLNALPQHPQLAQELMRQLAATICILKTRMELREIRAASDRVLYYLTLVTQPNQPIIRFERPLKMVAADLGLTPEAFYRTLARLEQRGAISRSGREITLNRSLAA